MSITFKHMDTQGMAHSLLGCSSLCAPEHSVLFSGCCCSPAHDKIPRGILMSKVTASSKCPPAGHLPKLSFGFLLPGMLPAQQLQGPGKAASCKASTSSCTTAGYGAQSSGRPKNRARRKPGGAARAKPEKLSQGCSGWNGQGRDHLTGGMARQGSEQKLGFEALLGIMCPFTKRLDQCGVPRSLSSVGARC